MYQRMLMSYVRALLSMDAENEGDEDADHLIRQEEEDRRQRHHHEHHDGGDGGLAPRRPRDLRGLAAHFLQEFERAESHRLSASIFPESFKESEQPSCAQPSFEGEPQRGLDCPG